MSTSRVFALRTSSALRAVTRRAAVPRQLVRPAARRGYASGGGGGGGHGKTSLSSDMPWLLASVGITGAGVAFLVANGPSKSGDSAHGDPHSTTPHEDTPAPDPAAEDKAGEGESEGPKDEEQAEAKQEEKSEDKDKDKGGDPKNNTKSSQTGSKVPPPPSDSSDMATDYEDKKKGQEQYKETIKAKDTKVATSSSDMPSKKTESEHPREDPQKGEGEAVGKGAPK